jgi:ligand-binding sensor domain-containing protein/two-component sensor histidine kinase
MRSFQRIIFIIFFLFFFHFSSSVAQSENQISFQKIDEENGLSDNNVQCIFKDKNGFMWIGTASGLNLLDGSDITVFKNNSEDIHSISNNSISAITDDSTGLLWIGTRHGLNSFDPFLREFTLFPLRKNKDINNDNITSLACDKNSNLFIGTSGGLFFYDKGTNDISFIQMPGNSAEKKLNNNITHIAIGKNGLLWLSTYNGLWSYNKNSNKFTHEISSSNDPDFVALFTCFIIDHSGKIWIGSWNKGLKEYDPKSKKITLHSQPGKLSNIITIAEIKNPGGKYLLSINNSRLAFDEQKNKFIGFSGDKNIAAFPQNAVLYPSDNGWLWMGLPDGLYFYNSSKNLIRHHRFVKPVTMQGISLLEWNKKILVTGSGGNFLKAYDENLNETDDYSNNSTKDVACLAIKYAGENRITAGTSKGIANIDLLTHKIEFQTIDPIIKSSPTINFITSLLQDESYNWWLFPWRNGIWMSDSTYKNIHRVFNNFLTDYGIAKPLVISDAIEDKNQNLWLTDYDEGIIFYNKKKNRFSKPFAKKLGDRFSASQLLYFQNNCYSFTGATLLKWNVDSVNIEKIKLPSQMDKMITSIAFDSIGHLWIATQKGLFAYDFKTKIFNHFTKADGLLSNNMDGSLYCCKNGKMIFGCPLYLSSFNPKEILATLDVPELKLSEIVVDGKPYLFDSSGKTTFGHEVNNFIFKWAVTDYNDPLNNQYYYRLKGIDKDWRYAGNRGDVEFASLSPGDYTLFLKAKNSNGINADKILQLHFEVMPPFWRTWWFFSLLFLAVCAFFYLLYKYRLAQVLKIEKLRNKISLDLHDDVGSTLSSISILSEMALHNKKEDRSLEMLSEIKENSISLMERMDDIVWSINPHNDTMESLFLRIKTFAAKLFEAREIDYKIDIDENIKQIHVEMENRQHIYLIMKEAINNMVKYAACTVAQIKVGFHSGQLSIFIEDNGKGFDTQKNSLGNGLNSMKKRAEQMNAFLEIHSKLQEGTTINLSVKIK